MIFFFFLSLFFFLLGASFYLSREFVWRREAMGMESDLGSDDSSIARRVGSWAVETEQRKLIGPINIGFYFLKPNKCFLLGINL